MVLLYCGIGAVGYSTFACRSETRSVRLCHQNFSGGGVPALFLCPPPQPIHVSTTALHSNTLRRSYGPSCPVALLQPRPCCRHLWLDALLKTQCACGILVHRRVCMQSRHPAPCLLLPAAACSCRPSLSLVLLCYFPLEDRSNRTSGS